MIETLMPSLINITSGLCKRLDDHKRMKAGLPPRPESPFGQTGTRCEMCVIKFSEEKEPVNPSQGTDVPNTEKEKSQYTSPSFTDIFKIISDTPNNNTIFGGGSFGGGGASGNW